MAQRGLYAAMWAVIISGALVLGGIYAQLFVLNGPAVTYSGLPWVTDRQVYRAGQVVSVRFEQCRFTDAPAGITVSLVSETNVYPQMAFQGAGQMGCASRYVAVAYIRSTVQPGTYRIVGRTTIQPSPLVSRVAAWESQPFTIEAWPDAQGAQRRQP